MHAFVRQTALLFLALRLGDLVTLAAGLWFVPRYVSPSEIGAVLPVTSFATFLALPMFAFAMTVMKESACLSAAGERGQVKSLLRGVFLVVAVFLVLVLATAAAVVPHFLKAMRVTDAAVGILVVAAAFLGCVAPVYTDALQSLKRFRALAVVEVGGAVVRFLVMLVAMPLRALGGYFAGQAALPAFRIVGSVCALRRDLSVPPAPYWNRAAVRRLACAFGAILLYQGAPMAAALVEQAVVRTALPDMASAGYYMVTRFSDLLHYLTFPLLLVMFPYTAAAGRRGESTRPFVLKCAAATLAAAAALAAVYAFCGRELLALLPHGVDFAADAPYLPWLVIMTALTTCQVFQTNAEVSAGRFGFLGWLVPLHVVYPLALAFAAARGCIADLPTLLVWFGGASVLRFAFAAGSLCIRPMVRSGGM